MASDKQIEELKDILITRKTDIESNINVGIQNIEILRNQDCTDDLDYAEISSDSFTSQKVVAQQQIELKDIEYALKQIQKKTYGVCDMCDEMIAIGRLKAKPFAKFCTSCREIYEKKQ